MGDRPVALSEAIRAALPPLAPDEIANAPLRRPTARVKGKIEVMEPERTIRLCELQELLKGAEITWPDRPPLGPPGLAVTTWREG